MQAIHLSPIDLFLQAGPVVKTVFALLALMSLWCWAIIFRCVLGLGRLQRGLARMIQGTEPAMGAVILGAGRQEALVVIEHETRAELRDRTVGAMRRRVQEAVERQQAGLGNLAVISSVSPFIGLFGTVWGIMTSFIGIAAAKDTSLAVVAPGIAEALAATALGLAVAIPAAFAYNRFVSGFGQTSRRLNRHIEDKASDVIRAALEQDRSR
jgi:biopolymer transport protein ExbB/TolQ